MKSKSSKGKAGFARTHVSKSDKVCFENDTDLADATSKVRNQIVKWQGTQNNIRLRQLREYVEYEVRLTQNANTSGALIGSIICNMCNSRIHLGFDQNNNFKLSNWIRHIKQCTQEKKEKQKGQLSLTNFFGGSSSSGENFDSTPIPESDPSANTSERDDVIVNDTYEISDEQGFRLAPPVAKK